MPEIKDISALKLEGLFFEDLQYHRELDSNRGDYEYEIGFNRSIADFGDGKRFRVSLTANVRSKNCASIQLKVTITGLFLCEEEDESLKQGLLKYNTIAIMFPYIRSQISFLSSQPDLPPITIPLINVVGMFKDVDQKEPETAQE